MKLRLVKNLILIVFVGLFVVSCFDDNEVEPYIPPTQAEELALLSEYIDTLTNRGLDIDTTDLGIYYIMDSIGEGAFPVDGDTCIVKYTGFFFSTEIFDSSGDNTYSVELGKQKVIEGWEDGLKVFNKGSIGHLIIPSEFAYGHTGYLSVPPYTSLVFEIEMVDIKIGS